MNVTGKLATRLIILLLLVLLVAGIKYFGTRIINRDSSTPAVYVFDSFAMGSVLTIKVRLPDKVKAEKAAEKALAEVLRLHKIFDPNDPESELSRLNAARTNPCPVPISKDMSIVLGEALRIRDLSGGLFEPGLGELIKLWGFNDERKEPRMPDSSAISALLDSLSWSRNVRLTADCDSVVMGAGAGSLDMGGIAQGYGVDRAIAVLAASGVNNALVNLGGEIGVLGAGANGKSWRVGIQHPRKPSCHLGIIELTQGSFVSTSGDYERFFFLNGKRYHHIFDPLTGYSAGKKVMSVTIITSSCLEADALATAAFVMGADRAVEFLDRIGAKGLVIYPADGDTESGNLACQATESFLKLVTPVLEGQLIQ